MVSFFLWNIARDLFEMGDQECARGSPRVIVLGCYVVGAIIVIIAVITSPITIPMAAVEWLIRFLCAPATCHAKKRTQR